MFYIIYIFVKFKIQFLTILVQNLMNINTHIFKSILFFTVSLMLLSCSKDDPNEEESTNSITYENMTYPLTAESYTIENGYTKLVLDWPEGIHDIEFMIADDMLGKTVSLEGKNYSDMKWGMYAYINTGERFGGRYLIGKDADELQGRHRTIVSGGSLLIKKLDEKKYSIKFDLQFYGEPRMTGDFSGSF